ncbi:MAG TPA: ABC transporter ATP-binding protein [Terrisporobacter glycolicus]|uniref:ABC transporter ATP-binding protein n=1 Tax=Terrisporobacter TaxID=1505652 RepID=UPI000E88D444|nr:MULTISPECIES: ABC transporter ATP-binding protein [Terrisporobacter]MBN9648112.1 ABC transporter ATP-binding protein [Terrisporobacter glycolicus]HBI91521.1 ABC transporter ATP-binding protein [Terrisporobacter hibernicus]
MRIRLENLSKKFKNLIAVNNLNIDIKDGELVCLLGPSGCGKSTTLSMIAGLENPTDGKIYFDDKDMTRIEAEYRDIGMVFQDYALYPHLTVFQNIEFPLKIKKLNKLDRKKEITRVAKLMQIEELLNKKPSKLSGGQQQRVAIARAIVKNPKILLLDEPLSNLDARLRIELREDIRKLQKKLGITTVFVTHDQEEALSISDKILLMDKGNVQQYCNPKEMYMKPKNQFVATFLGNPTMNLFDGLEEDEKIYMLISGKKKELVSNNIHKVANTKGKVKIGIRPEDFILHEDGILEGEIYALQTLGKDVYLEVKCEDVFFRVSINWDHDFNEGDIVKFNVKYMHIFNLGE